METRNRYWRSLLTACAALAVLLISTISAAQDRDHSLERPAQNYGTTISELTAEWWQFVHSVPASENPLFMDGLVDCVEGQSGNVLFLVGTLGGDAYRSCRVPLGRALFFPLFNTMWWNEPDEDLTVEEKRAIMEFRMTAMACDMSATLDGEPVVYHTPIVRAQSPPFRVDIIEDPPLGGVPGSFDDEAIADGYWILLPPLEPGAHELQFQGAACDPETHQVLFSVDVTYDLYVGPGNSFRIGRLHLPRPR